MARLNFAGATPNSVSESEFVDPNVPPPSPSDTTAAHAAAAAIQQMSDQAKPISKPSAAYPGAFGATPPSTPAPATPAPATPAPASGVPSTTPPISLTVTPPASAQAVGSTFQVAVMLDHGTNVFSVPLQVQYDPRILTLVNVDAGDFLSRDGKPVAIVHRTDDTNGTTTISSTRPPASNGVTGKGQLCTLTFKATSAGDSKIALTKVGARDSLQNNLPATGSDATVHIQ